MKGQILLLIIPIFFTLSVAGQKTDAISAIGLTVISQVNQGDSYITFPTDIGNLEPLMTEMNLIPNFYLRHNKSYKLLGVITPQVIIRVFKERSAPIRTPSYMPQFTFYYLFSENENNRKASLFWRLAHHSNGQDGDPFLENGEINLKNGDFSTNFFELGIIKTRFINRYDAYQFFKSSIEVHPVKWSAYELKGTYSTVRWHNVLSIFKLPSKDFQNREKKTSISLKGEATWMFGELNNWNWASLKRLNLGLTFYYHPNFLEDIGLFMQMYHGLDYYNIYFNHKLDVVRFGIMTEKLRF